MADLGNVRMGYAKKASRKGSSGKTGTKTKLPRRLITATQAEFDAQTERAKAVGVSWSTWARRKLAT